MSTPWMKLVQEKLRSGRLTNPKYSLSEAMKAAKKVYKKGIDVSAPILKKFSKKMMSKKNKQKKASRRKTRSRRKSSRRRK